MAEIKTNLNKLAIKHPTLGQFRASNPTDPSAKGVLNFHKDYPDSYPTMNAVLAYLDHLQ